MSRFGSFGKDALAVTGGGNLNVFVRQESSFDLLSSLTQARLEESLKYLETCDHRLRSKTLRHHVTRYAERYFLTGHGSIGQSDLEQIQTVVTKIWNGLKGDVTIKAGSSNSHGYVVSKDLPATKPYHNHRVRDLDGENLRAGAMHIDRAALKKKKMGAVTIIHEASHKYAGTMDYCYFEDDGVLPDGVFDDKAKALKNADSFAYFIYKIGIHA